MGITHVIEIIMGIGWAVGCLVVATYSITQYIIEKNKKL
tara:strand:+ start:557 stop:673 length:117 start_codon:yes stop_codon:yes gene_type:complete